MAVCARVDAVDAERIVEDPNQADYGLIKGATAR